MIYDFEITNLETMQIYRFDKLIHQKERLPIVGELQRSALVYLFEKRLVDSVSETSAKINPDGDLVAMQVTGGEAERYFIKIKRGESGEEGAEENSSPEEIQMKLQVYEETGLSPEEITALIADNKRLHELVSAIESVIRKGGEQK